MKRINGKTLFQRSDILSLKEKEQIYNERYHTVRTEETEEKTKLQQTDILMNECQLAYWEEKNMVISVITIARLASSSSLSISTNCQISNIPKAWIYNRNQNEKKKKIENQLKKFFFSLRLLLRIHSLIRTFLSFIQVTG